MQVPTVLCEVIHKFCVWSRSNDEVKVWSHYQWNDLRVESNVSTPYKIQCPYGCTWDWANKALFKFINSFNLITLIWCNDFCINVIYSEFAQYFMCNETHLRNMYVMFTFIKHVTAAFPLLNNSNDGTWDAQSNRCYW